MAKKINVEKTKEKMARTLERIKKCKADLEKLQAEYDVLENELTTAEATELLEMIKKSGLTLGDAKTKLLGK